MDCPQDYSLKKLLQMPIAKGFRTGCRLSEQKALSSFRTEPFVSFAIAARKRKPFRYAAFASF